MTDLDTLNPTRHEIASTDDVTVIAWDFGGEGVPVMFCHATGFHSRVWDPIIAALGDEVRAISVDLRGHGESRFPDGLDMEWHGMGRDALAVADHFSLGPGLLGVGHSMGGATILLANWLRPGAFGAAWLFEPIAIPSVPNMHKSSLSEGARKRREVFDSHDAAFERYISRPPFMICEPGTIRRYVDYGFENLDDGTVRLKCRGETEAQVFDATTRSGLFDKLGEIEIEAVVIGSGDEDAPAQAAPRIADALPGGTFEHAGDLTHFGPFQATERMAHSIRTHLLT